MDNIVYFDFPNHGKGRQRYFGNAKVYSINTHIQRRLQKTFGNQQGITHIAPRIHANSIEFFVQQLVIGNLSFSEKYKEKLQYLRDLNLGFSMKNKLIGILCRFFPYEDTLEKGPGDLVVDLCNFMYDSVSQGDISDSWKNNISYHHLKNLLKYTNIAPQNVELLLTYFHKYFLLKN